MDAEVAACGATGWTRLPPLWGRVGTLVSKWPSALRTSNFRCDRCIEDGERHLVGAMLIKATFKRTSAPVDLEHQSYAEAGVAHGKEDTLFGPSLITIVEQPGKLSGTLCSLGVNGEIAEVRPMQTADDKVT